jgi:hypothetical protein
VADPNQVLTRYLNLSQYNLETSNYCKDSDCNILVFDVLYIYFNRMIPNWFEWIRWSSKRSAERSKAFEIDMNEYILSKLLAEKL